MPSDDVLMRLDDTGRVLDWSSSAREAFGWSADEAVGRHVNTLVRASGTDVSGTGGLAAPPVTVRPALTGGSLVWEVSSGPSAPTECDLAILRVMFSRSPVGLYVLDERLRIVRVNTASQALHCVPADSLVGRVFTEAVPLAAPEQEAATAVRVLESGTSELDRLVRCRPPSAAFRAGTLSVSYVRLEGEDGHVLGLIAATTDVTDRERALRRLDVLGRVRQRVGKRLDVVAVCEELADAVVPAFSGIAVVEVIEDVVRGDEPPLAPVPQNLPLRRAAFRGEVSAYPLDDVRTVPAGTPFSRVLTDLRPRLVDLGEDTAWLTADPARAESIRRSRAHSLVVAPLALRGQALGLVSFYRHRDEDPFEEEDLALASDICSHAALCMENARRYTREKTIAATVKRRLLPQRPAEPSTMEVAHLHLPGTGGGGAWFDVIELAGARSALIVGDVSGQGMATATTMGQLRTALHSLAAMDLEPDELMARLCDTASHLASERGALPAGDPLHRRPFTVGALIAVYDPVTQECAFVRAGLPEPVVVLPDGEPAPVSVAAGPPLVGRGNSPFPATLVPLPAGSLLAMGNEDILGSVEDTLREGVAHPLPALCDHIDYALSDRGRNEKLVLLARSARLPKDSILTCPLPADLEAASLARAAVRHRLEAWNIDEEHTYATELIASELVSNAVRHGAPPIRLRLILDRLLTCEVSDAAPSAPRLKHARTIDEGGRGLFIVSDVADSWGTRFHAEGKTVWAQLPVRTG